MDRAAQAFVAFAFVGCGILAGTASGAQIIVNQNMPYNYGDAGEFVATPFAFPGTPVSLTNDGNFQTFCIQAQEHFTPGDLYNCYFSNVGQPGGPSLNEQTAWLYDQFIHGTLPGYDFSNSLNQRLPNAGSLQYALWQLEGVDTTGQTPDPSPATTASYMALANANAQPGNFYGVQIVVMYWGPAESPTFVQNQLVEFVPAPGTVGLAGLAGAVMLRRRR